MQCWMDDHEDQAELDVSHVTTETFESDLHAPLFFSVVPVFQNRDFGIFRDSVVGFFYIFRH